MSSKIKILDAALSELATIAVASSAVRTERINSDNTLNFSVRVKSGYGAYINDTSVFELDGDYFDIAYYKAEQQADGTLMIAVESEHVSYRLNDADYNVEYFTEIGTPTQILTAILDGTGFTVGTVDFATSMTFSLQQAASRRGLLMLFAAYVGGELEFDGFTISLLAQRGSSTPTALTVGKDITVVSKAVNKRKLDDAGNPTVSYTCGVYKAATLNLGDVVTINYDALGIAASLRVVTKAYDPYNPNNVTVEIGNFVSGLEDDLYRIETQAVKKDALLNGVRIGPEYGFEAVRNDKKARAYFKSDGMKFQSGDGTGSTWKDRLYYEYDAELDETVLVFDGALSATVITALSAVISPNLYAGKATIAELTVDQLDTSTKIQNYLNEDTSDVNYLKAVGQLIQFVTASVASTYGASRTSSGTWDMASDTQEDTYYSGVTVDNTTGAITFSGGATMTAWDAFNAGRIYRAINTTSYYKLTGKSALAYIYYDVYTVAAISTNYEQAKNRNGELLYWTDETHTAADTTEREGLEVFQYLYTEAVKLQISFELQGSVYEPIIELGQGTSTEQPTWGKAYIWKATDGLYIKYITETGGETTVNLTDFVDAKMRRVDTVEIDKTAGEISVLMEGETTPETLTYTEDATSMTITWPDSHSATISIA